MATSFRYNLLQKSVKTGQLLVAQRQADQAFDSIERGAKRADRQVNTLKTSIKSTVQGYPFCYLLRRRCASLLTAEQAKMLRVKSNYLQVMQRSRDVFSMA